jgi:hypothetical protein
MGAPSIHSQSSSSSSDLAAARREGAGAGGASEPIILAAQSPPIGVFPAQVREKETSIEMIKHGKWYGYVSTSPHLPELYKDCTNDTILTRPQASYDIKDASGASVLQSELTKGSLSSRKRRSLTITMPPAPS